MFEHQIVTKVQPNRSENSETDPWSDATTT